MVPAILLRSEKDAVSDEVKGFVFGETRKRSVEFFGAAPDRVSFAGGGIGNVNGPRIGANLKKGKTLLEAVDGTKAICLPSADQRGVESRSTDGAR
jgi:hypothetical protein